MKVIIAGSRTLENYGAVKAAIEESGFEVDVVISGCCRGTDILGERYAAENGLRCERHPAEWARYGRSAGPMRNARMLAGADALIAILQAGAGNRGTLNIISQARKRGLRVYVHICQP